MRPDRDRLPARTANETSRRMLFPASSRVKVRSELVPTRSLGSDDLSIPLTGGGHRESEDHSEAAIAC
jgi:hypothetical protein